MKNSLTIDSSIHTNTAENFSISFINNQIMKKLSNTSPFLLLLLPVFVMVILTLTVNTSTNDTEVVVKPTAKTTTSIVKQATAIFH